MLLFSLAFNRITVALVDKRQDLDCSSMATYNVIQIPIISTPETSNHARLTTYDRHSSR
jgi:hypothetical protein